MKRWSMMRRRKHEVWRPALPLLIGLCGYSSGIQIAAAAGTWFDTNSRKGLRIARYCAMLCSYAAAGA